MVPLGYDPQSVLNRGRKDRLPVRVLVSWPVCPPRAVAPPRFAAGPCPLRSLGHPPSVTTSDLSTHSTTSLISNEEQFEDYGEADDVDCAPSSPCPDDETRTNVYSDLGSSVSSRWPLGLQRPLGSRKSGRTNPASSRGWFGRQRRELTGLCSCRWAGTAFES